MFMITPLGAHILRMARERDWDAVVVSVQTYDGLVTGYQAFATHEGYETRALTGAATFRQALNAAVDQVEHSANITTASGPTGPEVWSGEGRHWR